MRKQIAAANWKMNLTLREGEELMNRICDADVLTGSNKEAVFAVPFPYLTGLQKHMEKSRGFFIAAQNCSSEKSGAYTGEVSAAMLKSIDVPYVLIGHSERREYYGETDAILAKKTDLAIENGLTPIFCCGEPLEVREAGKQDDHIAQQLSGGLFHLNESDIAKVVIAYEPIWAIGTGKTANSSQAQEMHAHIRKTIEKKYGKETAEDISILYGGSVKADNAKELFSQPDVDGGLVGGASLKADEFVSIINSLKTN